jgi:hypothetical protein
MASNSSREAPRRSRTDAVTFGTARTMLSTMGTVADRAERLIGFRSTTSSVFPIAASASARSPSSSGTSTTSAFPIPSRSTFARSWSRSGMRPSAVRPSTSAAPCSRRWSTMACIRSGVRLKRLTSSAAPLASASSTISPGQSAATLPFTESTGCSASRRYAAATRSASRALSMVRSPSR